MTKTPLCSLLLPSSKQSDLLCFEEEEQRNERAFAILGGGERYAACDDALRFARAAPGAFYASSADFSA